MERFLSELQSPGGATRRQWRYGAALVVAFALLIAVAVFGVVQDRRAASSRAYVAGTLAIQETILALENWNSLMEVHQRGFLLTGDADALRLRERAYAAARRSLRTLAAMVAAEPSQSRRTARTAAAIASRHARMVQVSERADQRGLEAARAMFSLRGEGSADPVLASLAEMRQAQAALLADRSARSNREATHFRRLLVYGTGLALLLTALTTILMLRQLARNTRLGRQLLLAHRLQADKALELERSNRELEAFSYTISHDLRAPLRHVDGYARMLQEDAGDVLTGDMRRYLDTISDSSRRMGALIDDLLAFSRLGRKPMERVRVDMNDLTERVLAEARGDRLAAQVEVGPLPDALADPVLLRQAWINLLSNAIKYSAPRGGDARIQVSGERVGAVTRYRIRDNGVGFDMRYADKLFGVFQRMHTQDEFEGTGVGLAIVQQVVQRHGGRVSAEAAPGEGACFTIELPAEDA